MHTVLRLLGRGFLFVLFVSKANAQTQTGDISGTVTHPAWAVVPFAAITIAKLETSEARRQSMNDVGANRLHGSVYEFFRNDKLGANDFLQNRVGQTRPVRRSRPQLSVPRNSAISTTRQIHRGSRWRLSFSDTTCLSH